MGETGSGGTPSQSNLASWASGYGQTLPTLSDGGWGVSNGYETDGYIPSQSLIGAGLEVLKVDAQWISAGEFESALPADDE